MPNSWARCSRTRGRETAGCPAVNPAVVAVVLAAAAGACLPTASSVERLRRVAGQGGGQGVGRSWSDFLTRRASPRTTVMQPWFGPAGGAAVGLAVAGITGSVPDALVTGAAALCAQRWWLTRARRLAAARRRAGLIELCQALAAELGSGAAARESLSAASRGLPDLEHLGAVARAPHGDVDHALRATAALPGASGLLRLAACWQVSERSGGGLAPSVARLAESLRDDEQVRREVTAQLAGPRATSVLLALLPGFGVLMGTALGVQPVDVLVGSSAGRGCLLVGAALEVAGLLWTRQITRRVAPP